MTRPQAAASASSAVAEAAAIWFARERGGALRTPQARAELVVWLAASPVHRRHYEDLRALWLGIDQLRADPELEALRQIALQGLGRSRRGPFAAQAIAASLAALVMVGAASLWLWPREQGDPLPPVRHYATRVGQIRQATLSDGSVAILDTDSAIDVRIGARGRRQVLVLRGRVLFQVAKMPARPFAVEAGTAVVTALGTRFDVMRLPDGLEVNLVEGRLRIEPQPAPGQAGDPASPTVQLASGDQLQVHDENWTLARGGAEHNADWVQGQIAFDNTPIAIILPALQRYMPERLVLADAATGARRVSAVIRTGDPMAFLHALVAMGVAHVDKVGPNYRISGHS